MEAALGLTGLGTEREMEVETGEGEVGNGGEEDGGKVFHLSSLPL